MKILEVLDKSLFDSVSGVDVKVIFNSWIRDDLYRFALFAIDIKKVDKKVKPVRKVDRMRFMGEVGFEVMREFLSRHRSELPEDFHLASPRSLEEMHFPLKIMQVTYEQMEFVGGYEAICNKKLLFIAGKHIGCSLPEKPKKRRRKKRLFDCR